MMKNKIVNLTGHDITIFDGLGNKLVVKAEKPKLMVDARRKQVGFVGEGNIQSPVILLNRRIDKDNLPRKLPGTVYIVSIVAAMAYPERDDFIVPGRKVRDNNGRVIGCLDFRLIV